MVTRAPVTGGELTEAVTKTSQIHRKGRKEREEHRKGHRIIDPSQGAKSCRTLHRRKHVDSSLLGRPLGLRPLDRGRRCDELNHEDHKEHKGLQEVHSIHDLAIPTSAVAFETRRTHSRFPGTP